MTFNFPKLLLFLVACQAGIHGEHKGTPKTVCYYATFITQYKPFRYKPANIPFHLCNSVVLYHEKINDVYDIEERDKSDEFVRDLVQTAKLNKRDVILAIGGYNLNEPEFQGLASPSNLDTFVRHLNHRMTDFNFSGLLIDWGYPRGTRSKTIYKSLLQRLSPLFRKKSWTLAITGPNNEDQIMDGYEPKLFASLVDEIHVNAHHLPGFFEGRANHQSPLFSLNEDYYSVDETMQLWSSLGVPREKLYVGTYVGGITSKREQLSIPYFQVCSNLLSGTLAEVWDSDVKASRALPAEGMKQLPISFESTRSIEAKAKYVKTSGFGGIAFKFINEDDFRGTCGKKNALLKTIHEAFGLKSKANE